MLRITAPAVVLALAIVVVPSPLSEPASVAAACKRASTAVMPSHIRVWRVRLGRVERVPIRAYTYRVTAVEWPSHIPYKLQQAGAVAVKQYAWKRATLGRRTSWGACYDVRDTTRDQIYRPGVVVSASTRRAVDSTWTWQMRRSGHLISTGYRTGKRVPCGTEIGKRRLYARSARHCIVHRGWSVRQVLERYYEARLRR